ncbi:ABC transporter ATP-binding protein [Mucilaginibacter celer]|uniref:ATP-binding cassette domain-containing protein n=1 Tax=Mucilaginibacter celer TaxID=2305508 RepID=A0A494W1K8_9SPHI|nr:ABC transporter ATP-binding protein [Mucilaginibacter celer]AYL97623.1 ATP-binding cassette domain-containing protein [Mucilaginibacter celer]
MAKIALQDISKAFNNKIVLNQVTLTINGGEVYCILGRNGAGKSTLINIACDIIPADEGLVKYEDGQLQGVTLRRLTGIQSQFETLIEELNAYDYLQFAGKIYGMTKAEIATQIKVLTDYFFEDDKDLSKPIKSYSTGMRKKVMLCAAFLHKPKYMFLDEPFANIDPIAANALCKLVNAYRNENRCIIISSHDLLYVNKIATHIGVIEGGKLAYNGNIDKFRTGAGLDEDMLSYVQPKSNESFLLDQIISEL